MSLINAAIKLGGCKAAKKLNYNSCLELFSYSLKDQKGNKQRESFLVVQAAYENYPNIRFIKKFNPIKEFEKFNSILFPPPKKLTPPTKKTNLDLEKHQKVQKVVSTISYDTIFGNKFLLNFNEENYEILDIFKKNKTTQVSMERLVNFSKILLGDKYCQLTVFMDALPRDIVTIAALKVLIENDNEKPYFKGISKNHKTDFAGSLSSNLVKSTIAEWKEVCIFSALINYNYNNNIYIYIYIGSSSLCNVFLLFTYDIRI